MVRTRGIWGTILIIIVSAIMIGCTDIQKSEIYDNQCIVSLDISTGSHITRTSDPDEDKISDINIMIFDEYGDLEYSHWNPDYGRKGSAPSFRLLKNKRYIICACANLGKRIYAERLEELESVVYHMVYPDEYREGIPMSLIEDITIPKEDSSQISMELERLMAKISIRMDRSRLATGTEMIVTGIRIGNCPKKVKVFCESKAESAEDCFTTGFTRYDNEAAGLNSFGLDMISDEVSLYMLENMQGRFAEEDIHNDKDKVMSPLDPRFGTCSYIEISMQYISESMYSHNDLIYRFYLGEDRNDLNIERNCHYRITICPEGDGLGEDSWRVDKSGICGYIDSIILSDDYLELNYSGQTTTITALTIPQEAAVETLIWKSNNPEVASVTQDGTVTAHSEGDCTITCSSTDGGNTEAQCKVYVDFLPVSFGFFPGNYIEGKVGDKIRIWCDYFPPNAVFDPGYEELELDRQRGIYDYDVDPDNHSVTLTLLAKGSGIVYMSVGEPVNMAEMAVIYITD
ncbi:MAG: DUF4906 domain-containing protein [Bacteroidales bacterium]|nr:DUF4906 domain-containing protein [Bacteroidales bacterium]